MIELVAAEEKAFEMKRRKQMIDARHPLGHAMVVGVFRLERELEQAARDFCQQAPGVPGKPRSVLICSKLASPSAIKRKQTSLFMKADCGARKTVCTKSLSRNGERKESWVCSSASRP